MIETLLLLIGIAFVLSWIPLMVVLARSYRRFRGARLVICPKTISPETVSLDALHAAWTSATGEARLRVASCSQQPHGCSEGCLEQVESSRDGCLVRERLKSWWEQSDCSACGLPIGRVRWLGRRPGLIGPDRTILHWRELTPAILPELLGKYRALCGHCLSAPRNPSSVEKRSGTAA